MGLVDYSDSDSDSEPSSPTAAAVATTSPTLPPPSSSSTPPSNQQPPPPPAPPSFLARPKKTTITKLVNRSDPGRIIVNLPSPADESPESNDATDAGPPAKRARTAGGGAGSFAGFNAMLPAPKNRNRTVGVSAGKQDGGEMGVVGRFGPGVQLKTSAEPGFSRDGALGDGGLGGGMRGGGLKLPPPTTDAGPGTGIPDGQKPPQDVKLVGKPLAFKPLSVSRKPIKKKPVAKPAATSSNPTSSTSASTSAGGTAQEPAPTQTEAPAPAPRKSLFFSAEPTFDPEPEPEPEPEPDVQQIHAQPSHDDFTSPYATHSLANAYQQQQQQQQQPHNHPPTTSLDSVADSLNLSASDRRAIFGRQKHGGAAADVRLVNMGDEYDRNDALRASGELQPTNQPVRAMQPGKHNVRQMVNMVHNQRDALEESFARSRNTKREASSKYGW